MKKTLAILMAALMLLGLTACSSAPEATTEPAATAEQTEQTAAPAEEKQSYTVGICQLVQHPALDAATQGFKDVLTEQLGDSVTIAEGNASNDIPTCATLVNGFVSSEVDFSGTVGGNVSGTSDLAPLDQQAAMVKELFPDAKTVGILYCSGEANSVYQANVVKECLEADGLTVNIFTFADSNDVSTVTTSAVAESDVLYIPTDHTAASCTEAIAAVTVPAGVPVIAGEEGICKGCGLATLSINYYDLGRTTGEMAVKILKGEADISEMPVEYFQGPVKKFNKDMAEKLNVTIPDEYVAIED